MEFIYIALVQNAREENAAAFVYDVYDGFQKNERTLAVAFDPEDAYNRVLLSININNDNNCLRVY